MITAPVASLTDMDVWFVAPDGDKNLPWQPTAWARSLFQQHPAVMRVEVADREPYDFQDDRLGRRYGWHRLSAYENAEIPGGQEDEIIDAVFDRMPPRKGQLDGNARYFDTPVAATSALATAVADCIRAMLEGEQLNASELRFSE